MSYNGSGTFLINSAGQPVVPGTTITTTAFNALTADLASGLTTAMTKDGQTVPTANIPMGGFKLTGLGAGTSATDAAQFGQLQNAPVATLITVAGADTITGTLVQTLTAYATGQQFSFVAAGTNTTAVTLNIDGLGAKAVTRTGAVALAAGALVSGQMAIVEYDGTRFQLINANAFTNLTVSGALTVGTTLAVTGVATLTAQPILSSLTASLPVFSDASKGLVSNAMTGTGSVMMSASPTTTGTLTAAAINASGLVAMAGAATVGTTLGVTGTSTMAAINASGVVVVGAGTTGINVAQTVVNGGSGSAGGWGLYGQRNSANTFVMGSDSALFGGTSSDTSLYAYGTNVLNFYGAATKMLTVSGTGISTPGTLGVTGTSTMAAINASGLIAATSNISSTLAQNSASGFSATNSTNGTSARAYALLISNAGNGGIAANSPLYSDFAGAGDSLTIFASGLSGGIQHVIDGGSSQLTVASTGVTIPGTLGVTGQGTFSGGLTSQNFSTSGQAGLGAALATSATAGHVSISSCVGPPTGVPTPSAGTIAMIFDSSNQYLYAYLNGSWKKTTQFT